MTETPVPPKDAIVVPSMPGEASAKLLDEETKRIKEHKKKMERTRKRVVDVFVEEGVTLQEFSQVITKILKDNNAVVDNLTVKEVVQRHAS